MKRKIKHDETLIPPKLRTLSKKKADERVTKIETSVTALKEISGKILDHQNVQKPEPNEYDVFGQFVACQLKKLPESSALLAMQHIQTHLFELRMKPTQNYIAPTPSPNYSSHSNIDFSHCTSENSATSSTMYYDMDLPVSTGHDNNLLAMAIKGIFNQDEEKNDM